MPNRKDAIALLEADHELVRNYLEELTESTERAAKTRARLLEKIRTELDIHMRIEEEIFYPALAERAKDHDHKIMVPEAREEHRAVRDLVLPDLEKTDPSAIEFTGRAKVLKELVEHHVQEEEEEMFPAARDLMSHDELIELGERMAERKTELMRKKSAA